ncbi:hypothetical protein, partial [Kosakonia sacchari]|uniref:hypothetical protein n=1 Tax=Kosakonia sacchari TaxID=1158459 RepID=UPI0028A8E750
SGRILTEKENVCVGISFPRGNKNGAEKIFNAIGTLASSGVVIIGFSHPLTSKSEASFGH